MDQKHKQTFNNNDAHQQHYYYQNLYHQQQHHHHPITPNLQIHDFDQNQYGSSQESSLSAYLDSTDSEESEMFLDDDRAFDLFLCSDEIEGGCKVLQLQQQQQQQQMEDDRQSFMSESGISICDFNSSCSEEELNSDILTSQQPQPQPQQQIVPASESSSIVDIFEGFDNDESDQSQGSLESLELDDIIASDIEQDIEGDDDDTNSEDFPLIPSSDWGYLEDFNNNSDTPVTDFSHEPSSPVKLVSASKSPFMTTTPRSREWVLENLESLASQLLCDLSIGRAPTVELANRSCMEAIAYDEENGVIRRKQDYCLSPADREAVKVDKELVKDGVLYDNDFEKSESTSRTPNPSSTSTPTSGLYTKTHRWASVPSIMRTIDLIHENVCKNTISTKRDLYYRDVLLFGSQPAVDNIVEDLACTLKIPRSSLNVVAGSRSVIYGSVRMVVKVRGVQKDDSTLEMTQAQEQFDTGAGTVGQEEGNDSISKGFSRTDYNMLVTIPTAIEDILEIEIHHKTRFILVIEKESTMDNLISLGFCESYGPCILLSSKGYPDRVARQLLKLLSDMIQSGVFRLSVLNVARHISPSDNPPSLYSVLTTTLHAPLDIPLLALVDCDPHGIQIHLSYRCGSVISAYDNANLAVPRLQCLGQVPSDWDIHFRGFSHSPKCSFDGQEDGYGDNIERCWDRFERTLIPLTHRDRCKLVNLLTLHPYIRQHKEWKRQISRMLMMNRKSELQSLCQGETIFCHHNSVVREECDSTSKEKDALVSFIEHKLREPRLWL